MNLLLFLMILVVSFIVVRIGAIAFELTGLEWSLAKFQSLSCFTGTGFTTKEAELITVNPQRRRIASVLIVLGHAGLVTLIATFANSLRADDVVVKFQIPFLHSVISSRYMPLIQFGIIIVGVYTIYKIFTKTTLAAGFTNALRRHIVKKELIKPVSFEELMVATGGYGVSQIEVCKDSPVLNKSLRESNLRKQDISLLAIERDGLTMPNPAADTKIILGDKLTCFGRLEDIRKRLCVVPK